MSQRGLSGTIKAKIRYIPDGKTGAQNIHLHPIWPFHEFRISSPGITGLAISQFAIWADRIPRTMANWYMATNFPLTAGGDTSDKYIGEMFEAIPIPTPLMIRNKIKTFRVVAAPVPNADKANTMAARIIMNFLPYLSDKTPEIITPITHPKRALLITHP